jgi:hypothetical protein
MTSKLIFYDMESEFQNKVVLPKMTCEIPSYNFPEHVFGSNSIIWTFTNLDKGSLPISPNW